MTQFTRRAVLAAGSAAIGLASVSARAAPPATPLKTLAAAKGIGFGTALSASHLADPAYMAIVRHECASLVAENEHKMYTIIPTADQENYAPADALRDFAVANGLRMRGHTLLWHHPRWMPAWLNETTFTDGRAAEAFLGPYIDRVAGRYAPFIYSWDVINETVDDATGALRETSLSRAMGHSVIDFCFHRARAAAPTATLAYNDYMSWESGSAAHRRGVLKLLEGLRARNVPIDALGIQSHSNYDMPDEFTPAKQRAWREFCDAVVGMGLKIYLTEFDVNDTRLSAGKRHRDRLIASYTKDYLDIMFSYDAVEDLMMWGMIDKYSWLQDFLPRTDDVEKRPTLYDSNYAPKPMREAVAAALAGAPARSSMQVG